MAVEEKVELEGEVVEALKNLNFRVELENGHVVLAHLAGKMRRFRIRVMSYTWLPAALAAIGLKTGSPMSAPATCCFVLRKSRTGSRTSRTTSRCGCCSTGCQSPAAPDENMPAPCWRGSAPVLTAPKTSKPPYSSTISARRAQ